MYKKYKYIEKKNICIKNIKKKETKYQLNFSYIYFYKYKY